MRTFTIDDANALSAKIVMRDGMLTLSVLTDLSLAEDDNGLLSPELQQLVDRASRARDMFRPSITRIDIFRRE